MLMGGARVQLAPMEPSDLLTQISQSDGARLQAPILFYELSPGPNPGFLKDLINNANPSLASDWLGPQAGYQLSGRPYIRLSIYYRE